MDFKDLTVQPKPSSENRSYTVQDLQEKGIIFTALFPARIPEIVDDFNLPRLIKFKTCYVVTICALGKRDQFPCRESVSHPSRIAFCKICIHNEPVSIMLPLGTGYSFFSDTVWQIQND